MDPMDNHPLRFLVLVMAGWINRRQQDVIEYLQEENRVLRGQLVVKRLWLREVSSDTVFTSQCTLAPNVSTANSRLILT